MRFSFPNIPAIPDDNPLVLDEKEKKTLNSFALEIAVIQRKQTLYLREIAKEKGIIAPTLEELKSENGEPFEEKKPDDRMWGRDYRVAVAMKEKNAGVLSIYPVENAYLCHTMYLKEDPDSCGWVKGRPIQQEYDDIGCLGGSAGYRFYCKICGKQIGEHRLSVS